MSNLYTEQENTWAAMISNCKITNLQIQWARDMIQEQLREEGREEEYDPNYIPTFAQIVAACEKEDYDLWFRDSTEGEQKFFDNAATEEYGNWKIVGIYDDNDNSGFYAVAIETGEYTTNNVENGVIFSVRGTEPTTDEQIYLDLVNTDLNILNSDVTAQEFVMYDFLDKEFAALLNEKGYSNLATTGHSLGGYLSFSAAGHIVMMGGRASEIFMQGTNIDGPGVTEENLEANADTYAKLDPYLTHYHYTYIGSLLSPICSNYISITTASNIEPYANGLSDEDYNKYCNWFGKENADRINEICTYIKGSMGKHALASLQFDTNGNYDTDGNWHILDNIKEDDFVCSLQLEGADKEDYLRIIGEYMVGYATHLVYSLVYDEGKTDYTETEYDLVAEIANNVTEFIDNDNILQIVFGGILKTVTDYVYYAGIYANSYNEVKSAWQDKAELYSDLNNISTSFINLFIDYTQMIGQPAGSVSNWFDISNDIMQLSKAIDSCDIISESKTYIKDTYLMLGNFYNDVYGTGIAVAKESILFRYENVIKTTERIVNHIEDFDSLEKYIEAQKIMTEEYEQHYNKLRDLSKGYSDNTTTLHSDFNTYIEKALAFTNAMVLQYSDIPSNDLNVALTDLKVAQEKLLCDFYELNVDSIEIVREVGTSMRDYISNSFKVAHAWGNYVISDFIIDVGNSLCDNLRAINMEEVISGWVLHVDDLFNDATDYIYGLAGGVELRGNSLNNNIYGGQGNNSIYGEAGNDVLNGGAGNDAIIGGLGNDLLNGEVGNDALYGQNDNDTLVGGHGNDRLEGAEGADTYIFHLGDGMDTVYDHEWDMGNVDKIVFGEGIQASDVVMERNGNDLVVKYSENDSFTVKHAYHDNYGTGRYFVEQVEFSDGTVWDTEEIANRANIQVGTEGDDEQTGYYEAVGYHQGETFHMLGGNDTVNAGEGNDTIYGDEGDDTLYGHNGNDTLVGGTGNDYMTGDAGADSFVFNLGDGTDTVYDHEWDMGNVDKIVFGEGIQASDVVMERNGNNLVVKYSANDSFTVLDAYHDNYGTGRYFVEQVEFSDGTVWDTEEIANRANIQVGTEGDDEQNGYYEAVGYHQGETFHMLGGNDTVSAGEGNDTIYGDEGDDTLYGHNGNDTLIGGTGNDYMTGDAGADSFVFNIGDGTDTVYDHEWDMGNVDKIVFGEGIQASDVVMERNGNDLVVKYSENDSFTVKHAYHDNYGTGRYFVEQVEFADGTVWDTEEIANRANIQVGTEGDDEQNGYYEAVGYHQGETYHMLAGNDTVSAGEGNDTVHGDEGNDTLYGENGNDTLIGGAGNDTLAGGNGEDMYVIGAEDGDDVINNYDTTGSRINDKIVYGEGVLVDDISITRSGNDLLISNAKTQQTTVIASAYSHEYNQLYNLEFYDEDTAVIDYSTTSLNITYAVKEEIEETETEEVLAEELAMEEIPEIVEPAEAVTETQEAVSDVADDSAVIVTDENITKMTGLVVQEMAGADADGIPQIVNPDANVVAESDSLLWVE
ncbi:MAG: hypothetical protein IJZ42_09360 [Lachnospiraceae bacterium]|nr:hypothetical protein [Lachnospiraceae bacterium]